MYESLISQIQLFLTRSKFDVTDQTVNFEQHFAIAKQTHRQSIFVVGAGRSGLVGKMFAMRLMHTGYNAHVVGETTTPGIIAGDILIAITSSGETQTVRTVVEKAILAHAKILVITKTPDSTIAKLAGGVFVFGEDFEQSEAIYPMGTIFELSVLIFLEGVIGYIIRKYNIDEQQMKERHANLE